jgi:hypothetical protein
MADGPAHDSWRLAGEPKTVPIDEETVLDVVSLIAWLMSRWGVPNG